jgi:hypothetical protein
VVSPGPVTDVGGVEAIQDDGTFEVRLASPKSQWLAGENIDIEVGVTYIGAEDEVETGHSAPFMIFDIKQLDGPIETGSAAGDVCTHTTFWRDLPHRMDFDKGGGYDADAPNLEWYQAFSRSDSFKLTPGTWRITALLELFVPECGKGAHKLAADIVINVVGPVAAGGLETYTGDDYERATVIDYAASQPDTFGEVWIDRPLLGPVRIATSWTRDIERHRAWLEEHVGSKVDFVLYRAEFTRAELDRVEEQIRSDMDWLATVPADQISFGGTGPRNRVGLDVSSAVPNAANLIRDHYAAKFGFDPRMLIVTSDGTGASFVPYGTLNVTVDGPGAPLPAGMVLSPDFHSDISGLHCGGDYLLLKGLACQEGHWLVRLRARRDDGDLTEVGSAEFDIVAGKTTNVSIEVGRWP